MNRTYKQLLLFLFLVFPNYNANSTVLGPIIIDLIGYDKKANIIYFARTDWAECNCETDLYKYFVSKDSIEIISKWADKYAFHKDKQAVIKDKGLAYLSLIDSISPKESMYLFEWLSPVSYHSAVSMKDELAYPFQISISTKKYYFKQCIAQTTLPRINEFRVSDNKGLIFIRYRGECNEGNKIDRMIFYQRSKDGIESRELIIADRLSGHSLQN